MAPRSIHWLFVAILGSVPPAAVRCVAADIVPYDTEPESASQRLPPQHAAAGFAVPAGFHVRVFVHEPDVQNPIAMAWDGRGRLWIAENYTYAESQRRFEFGLRDRILIFNDRDGDGQADSRQVFTDDLQLLSSIELGYDGIWALCPPRLIFIPDRDHDDVPDGPAVTLLDGFDVPRENYHTFANGLHWGPDGWLYGRCGASSMGRIGVPGTTDERRIPIHGGVWRYHPRHRSFEVLCHGTTNPWGHDWNEVGEAFFINTVNGHLWHVIPGAHFRRPHTIDPNPRAYDTIDTHANHYHWDNRRDWTDSRSAAGEHDELGGGHAHIGASIYLGDNWPEAYRGRILTLNLHGRRVNIDRLERTGSGYVGRHEPDILRAADPWFRGLELGYGADGAVYILDWSDAGECHEHNGVHRTSGRIYKVAWGDARRVDVGNLATADQAALVQLHRHANEWWVRQARVELSRRFAAGSDLSAATGKLREQFDRSDDIVLRLRALWSLWSIDAVDTGMLLRLLDSNNEHLRVWGIRLLTDRWPLDTIHGPLDGTESTPHPELLARFATMARDDPSPFVRLALASTLQRLPLADRPQLAAPLLAHGEDAGDHNLPLMLWYGLMPVADADPAALATLAEDARIPVVRRHITRRLAENLEESPAPVNRLVELAAATDDPQLMRDVIDGLADGLAGWQRAAPPAAWSGLEARLNTSADAETRNQVRALTALFGDGRALDELRRLALDDAADLNLRKSALATLIQQQPPDLREVCEKLLTVRFLNTVAARGLAKLDDPGIGVMLARSYGRFHPSERPAVIETLVSRPSFVGALLDQMQAGRIPRADLSAAQARQVRSLENHELTVRLSEIWGEVNDSTGEARAMIQQWKSRLTPDVLAAADQGRGRVVYTRFCANCHRLHGQGGATGPDLTGSGRQNLDYLLGNIITPSDVVPAEYRISVVALQDGRVLNGVIVTSTDRTITLQTPTDRSTIDRNSVAEIRSSTLSLMPDGLLRTISDDQFRDLVSYLMHPTQVPLPAEANAADAPPGGGR
jgi:putative membrane-bound dehydrogenase-like protein